MQSPFRRMARACWLLMLLALVPAAASAQSGRLIGNIADSSGTPIPNAQAQLVGTRHAAQSSSTGRFVISGIAPGRYSVKVMLIGFTSSTVEDVVIVADQETPVSIVLGRAPNRLESVVVSASRQAERVTDAPATITAISAQALERSIGGSYASALKSVKGIDIIQTGMTSVAINARGFNSSFNNRMLMMEDGRIAVLPENGLPVGSLSAIPKIDLAGIEVLVGPGAALYGADASNGVMTMTSKDPREYPGTSAEVIGGSRQFSDVQVRHAAVIGEFGFKVAAQVMSAQEFRNSVKYAPRAAGQDSLPEIGVNWRAATRKVNLGATRYLGDARVDLLGGYASTDGVGQTNVGRNLLDDWVYNNVQLRYVSPRMYANVYRTQSLSGNSFALNRYTSARAQQPASVSDDSVKMLSDWPADGRMYAGEIQNNFRINPLLGTKIIWGGQFRMDRVSSDRQWLNDRVTGEDLQMNQRGVYLQSETPVVPWMRVILAGRYDQHDDYDAQFSPKAALVFKPTEDQAVRFTYNKAFKSPTTLQNHFNIVDFVPFVAVIGNQKGFTIRNSAGADVGTIAPVRPEENQTYEVGYKGVIAKRLFLDATLYDAHYDHFLTPLIVIANPLAGAAATFAHQGGAATPVQNPDGRNQIVLTYRNLGRARIHGLDAGFRYLLSSRWEASGTVGLVKMDEVDLGTAFTVTPAQARELSALNAPSARWTLGLDGANLYRQLRGGLSVRHSGDYYFASGINTGSIPTFTTLDLNASYPIPRFGASLNVSVANLFTCAGDRNASGVVERSCGFDQRHAEMIRMPEVGTMLFVGLRYNRP